jgi:cytidylate kinase
VPPKNPGEKEEIKNKKDKMKNPLQIAIDGPAGAGKSTVARAVAARLGITYLDTGAMYRAVGLKALRLAIPTQDEKAVGEMAAKTDVNVLCSEGGGQTVLLDGEDVSELIRTPEVSMAASDVSKWPAVRRRLVALQQKIAGRNPVVMDGRDIGTHVLPDAPFKFFLTASAQARARRRQLELAGKGVRKSLGECLRDIEGRDLQDTTRAASPLTVAPGAEVLDTSDMTALQAAEHIIGKVVSAI